MRGQTTSVFQDIIDILGVDEAQFDEELLNAALSNEYDNCLTWKDWETFPLVGESQLEHLQKCQHCSQLRTVLENNGGADWFIEQLEIAGRR
jgi:hypothetical protein